MKISDIDSNFKVENNFDREDIVWLDSRKEPFKIYGLYNAEEQVPFVRMPIDTANAVSEAVGHLNYNTAGGRVRFKTSSPYIAINAHMSNICKVSHMTLSASAGFDVYIEKNGKSIFAFSYIPPTEITEGYSELKNIDTEIFGNAPYNVTINFPLYSGVDNLYIGLKKDSLLEKSTPYINDKPVVFYGSSITQGGCASRPGNCYQNLISKNLNMDYINLGFSGSAKGEPEISDYMSKLSMCCFVCDYDHNAAVLEDLIKTHYAMYEKIRENNPNIPYIMISRPCIRQSESADVTARRRIIKESYEKAIANGDKNVYFIDGSTFFQGDHVDECTVDLVHPNDLGFFRMSEKIGELLKKLLF